MVMDFLSSMGVGKQAQAVEERGAGGDVSVWELRECRERGNELWAEVAIVGAEDELGDGRFKGLPPPLAAPYFTAFADEE